ncbi:MAG: discoidin domain-containing protein [Chthoniobacterales bacterium]
MGVVFMFFTACSLKGVHASDLATQGEVTVFSGKPANRVFPARALGVGLDGHAQGDELRMLTRDNVAQMQKAGLKSLSYRLRTELAVEAWHWNPKGTWSDAKHHQGYWISDAYSDEPILVSYGYRLPRRGNTVDEANNDGYSRLDDGDRNTFWKSNPYLASHFTKEGDFLHPQWVLIDLGTPKKINALKILWGIPYALDYEVQYSNKDDVYFGRTPPGGWKKFPHGKVKNGSGGDIFLRLSDKTISARYLRIRMTRSSESGSQGSSDIRDRLGFAIREIEAGSIDAAGNFQDEIIHKRSINQTLIYVSSTDPWHRELDRDPKTEQPGFDLVVKSGLGNGLPILIPAAVLYDTPENAAAEAVFIKSRGWNVPRIEMGEEPDGQRVDPVDFAALYVQFANALHKVNPDLELGGPSFVTIDWDKKGDVTYRFDHRWWIKKFWNYLGSRHQRDDFKFVSFEWYPFDDICKPAPGQLVKESEMLRNAVDLIRHSGLPHNMPMLITEFGYSVFSGRPEVDMEGALLNADIAAQFVTLKGETSYLYGYEPNHLENTMGCSWGNHMLFLQNTSGSIRAPVATYYGARLLTQEWMQPIDAEHQVYTATTNIKNKQGELLVTAYAVRRPDKRWSVMLVNKSPSQSYQVSFNFAGGKKTSWRGLFDLYQFSSKEYLWHADGKKGYPLRSNPPSHQVIKTETNPSIMLPPWSISVIRSSR